MTSISKQLIIVLLALILFTSCAIHKEFPFICFNRGCVKDQWNIPKLRHNVKIFRKQTVAKIYKKKNKNNHLESRTEINIAKVYKDSLRVPKSTKAKTPDSIIVHEPINKKNTIDTLANLSKKNNLTINYPFNDANISEEDRKKVEKYFEYIDVKNISKIIVRGYTDNLGSSSYNKNLSDQRAKKIYEYLIKLGIPSSKLLREGLDSQNPIADNITEEGKYLNRRVEIEIIK